MDEVPVGSLLTLAVAPAEHEPLAERRAARFAELARAVAAVVAGDAALALDVADDQFVQLGGPDEASLGRALAALRTLHPAPITVGAPQVGYREAIGAAVEVDQTWKRHDSFARVRLRVERRAGGFSFEPCSAPLPAPLLAGVVTAVQAMARGGPLHGYPVIATAVTVLDAAWHERDSTPPAFAAAARAAFGEAMVRAGGLLEPVMRVTVSAPAAYHGAIRGDILSRRGTIEDHAARGGPSEVTALVPLGNLLGYEADLASISQGHASHELRFACHRPVPRRTPPGPPPAMAAALRH